MALSKAPFPCSTLSLLSLIQHSAVGGPETVMMSHLGLRSPLLCECGPACFSPPLSAPVGWARAWFPLLPLPTLRSSTSVPPTVTWARPAPAPTASLTTSAAERLLPLLCASLPGRLPCSRSPRLCPQKMATTETSLLYSARTGTSAHALPAASSDPRPASINRDAPTCGSCQHPHSTF